MMNFFQGPDIERLEVRPDDAVALAQDPVETPHGATVNRRTSSRISSVGSRTIPRKPKPPASVTALTRSARATPPIPASTTGHVHPRRSQTGRYKALTTLLSAYVRLG